MSLPDNYESCRRGCRYWLGLVVERCASCKADLALTEYNAAVAATGLEHPSRWEVTEQIRRRDGEELGDFFNRLNRILAHHPESAPVLVGNDGEIPAVCRFCGSSDHRAGDAICTLDVS